MAKYVMAIDQGTTFGINDVDFSARRKPFNSSRDACCDVRSRQPGPFFSSPV
ncbi:MAG: hypothetical protein KKH33_02365 [Alphaproteobacteria bacterium]|nr:hypothetical protein [Alphaproteobacteria bacterium]